MEYFNIHNSISQLREMDEQQMNKLKEAKQWNKDFRNFKTGRAQHFNTVSGTGTQSTLPVKCLTSRTEANLVGRTQAATLQTENSARYSNDQWKIKHQKNFVKQQKRHHYSKELSVSKSHKSRLKLKSSRLSHNRSVMSFKLPDPNDPEFCLVDSEIDSLNSQLRTNPRMPKIKGDLLNIKVQIDTKKKKKTGPELMNSEVLLFKNKKKPKSMKKHEWEIHKKKRVQKYKRMKQRQRNMEHQAVKDARARLLQIYEPLEQRLKREKKQELEDKMKDIYGFKAEDLESDANIGNLLQQKAIIDLIRHGGNIEINSTLIKGYLTKLRGNESKNLDTQFIKDIDLSSFKKWDKSTGKIIEKN